MVRCDFIDVTPPLGLFVFEGLDESEDFDEDDVEAEEASPRTPFVMVLIKSIFESVRYMGATCWK